MTTGSTVLSHPFYHLLSSMHDNIQQLNAYHTSHQDDLPWDSSDEKLACRIVKMLHPIFASLECHLSVLQKNLRVDAQKQTLLLHNSSSDVKPKIYELRISDYDDLMNAIDSSVRSYCSEPSAQLLQATLQTIQVAQNTFRSDLMFLHGWLYHSYLSRLSCASQVDIDYMQETLEELQKIFTEYPHLNTLVEYDWLYLDQKIQEKKKEFSDLPIDRPPPLVKQRRLILPPTV